MAFTVLSDGINQECRNSSVVTQSRYINIDRDVESGAGRSWEVLMPVRWNVKACMPPCEGLLVSLALTSWSTTGISSGEQQKRVDEWRISGAEKPEHLPLVGNTNGKEYILHGSRSWTLGRLPLSLKQISCPKWS